jgi:AraC-like DNA-binding protein
MIYPAEADIIPFIRNQVSSLQPYAKANQVLLTFSTECQHLVLPYQPFSLGQTLTQALCHIINLIPHETEIQVRLRHLAEKQELSVEIENSGINLLYVNGSIQQTAAVFNVQPLEKGTLFCLRIPLHNTGHAGLNGSKAGNAHPIPQFYAEIRKRLRSHFTQPEKMVEAIASTRPQEAAFLQKINALIKANLQDETFDTSVLCKAMAMSRTQLFRRLKPLIRQAPALYIKTMRLQRAKELLETSDMTVSEVAFKTGFHTLSHFTKVFQQQFGVLPSAFRRVRSATNE